MVQLSICTSCGADISVAYEIYKHEESLKVNKNVVGNFAGSVKNEIDLGEICNWFGIHPAESCCIKSIMSGMNIYDVIEDFENKN